MKSKNYIYSQQKSLENIVQDFKLAFESNEFKDPLINLNCFNAKK
jgi:hypothetical protein